VTYGFVTKWDTKDSGQKGAIIPVGISLDSEGNVYVIEELSGQIKKYTSNGEFLDSFGGLSGANGITIDSNDNIYVPVWISGVVYNIQKMKNDGTFINKLVTPEKYAYIQSVYDLAVDSQNNLYAVNYYSSKFYKWASDGTFIKSWEYPKKDAYTIGDPDAYLRPWDIAIDSKNNLGKVST